MIMTCGICGHRGEDGTTYRHDCYCVFRERGEAAAKRYCEMCDEWMRARECRKCGAPTVKAAQTK